jgi:hypothetical protein
MRDLVGLFDRFLDGPMAYDLEWDDFISWKNENPNIEEVRDRLGQFEPLLFSQNVSEKAEYRLQILNERNRAAALAGIAARE